MKRLMTVAIAAVLAGGAYAATCGTTCSTYDFKAAITRPIGKASASPCSDCGYRTKATGKLAGWFVLCDCSTPALVLVVDKETTAYVSFPGWTVLNEMGKTGTEAEGFMQFTVCDTTVCNDGTVLWDVFAAGFGKMKAATATVDALITDLSGSLVGTKPGAVIVTGTVCSSTESCTCVLPCPITMTEGANPLDSAYIAGDTTALALDAVSGTWSMKYDKKFTENGTIESITAALIKLHVTEVVEDCQSLGTPTEWAAVTTILTGGPVVTN